MTAIRVEVDSRENERRIEEEDRRQDRLWRLQEEAVASGKANAAVEMRWNDLMQYNMPQDLHREIEAQKAACKAIIRSKDQLIREFQVMQAVAILNAHASRNDRWWPSLSGGAEGKG